MKLSATKLIVIAIIIIVVILILSKRKCKTCPRESQELNAKAPQCLSNVDCASRETCSEGLCTKGLCPNCDFNLLPTFEAFPPSFGNNIWQMRVQSTGKLVAIDYYGTKISRHNTDGTLDLTFGVGGLVTTPNSISGIRLLRDDSILITCTTSPAIVRKYDPNGIPDLSFGVAGVFTAPTPSSHIPTIEEASDGSLRFIYYSSGPFIQYIGKMSSLGVVDLTFGTSGYVNFTTIAVGSGVVWCDFYEIKILEDDRIVLAGNIGIPSNYTFGSMRLTTNGSLDLSYGVNGVCIIPPSSLGYKADVCTDYYSYGATYLPDGTAFVHGYVSTKKYSNFCDDFYPFTMVKITPAGVFDLTYGENGLFTFYEEYSNYYPYYENYGSNVVLPCDGGQVIALNSYGYAGTEDNQGLVIKVTPDGKLDTTFPVIKAAFDTEYYYAIVYHEGRIFVGGERSSLTLLQVYSCDQ